MHVHAHLVVLHRACAVRTLHGSQIIWMPLQDPRSHGSNRDAEAQLCGGRHPFLHGSLQWGLPICVYTCMCDPAQPPRCAPHP